MKIAAAKRFSETEDSSTYDVIVDLKIVYFNSICNEAAWGLGHVFGVVAMKIVETFEMMHSLLSMMNIPKNSINFFIFFFFCPDSECDRISVKNTYSTNS